MFLRLRPITGALPNLFQNMVHYNNSTILRILRSCVFVQVRGVMSRIDRNDVNVWVLHRERYGEGVERCFTRIVYLSVMPWP